MKENHTTEILLESQHTPLSSDKKVALWKNIEADISTLPTPSPYVFTMVTKKTMTSIALALVLMFSLGGTAYASNDARPGDILFPVDQALEEIRLALVRNDDTRAQLQIAFAEERLNELRSILAERNNNQIATSTVATFEAEADVFTNTTIVTVEINDRKTTFETTAKTKSAVIDEIVRRYSVDRNLVEQNLDFEVEDRASRVSDSDDDSNSNDDDDNSSDDSSSDDDSNDDSTDDSDERVKIEVRVEEGQAEVRMEYGNKRDEFTTTYTTRSALVAQLAARSGLTQSEIENNLDLEVKD